MAHSSHSLIIITTSMFRKVPPGLLLALQEMFQLDKIHPLPALLCHLSEDKFCTKGAPNTLAIHYVYFERWHLHSS